MDLFSYIVQGIIQSSNMVFLILFVGGALALIDSSGALMSSYRKGFLWKMVEICLNHGCDPALYCCGN